MGTLTTLDFVLLPGYGVLVITGLTIKIAIYSTVIGLKISVFPLIHLPRYQAVIGQFVIGQFNKPITFKVVV